MTKACCRASQTGPWALEAIKSSDLTFTQRPACIGAERRGGREGGRERERGERQVWGRGSGKFGTNTARRAQRETRPTEQVCKIASAGGRAAAFQTIETK